MAKPVDLVIRVKADTGDVAPGMKALDKELDQATKSAKALDKELGDVTGHDVDIDINTQAITAARRRINDLRDDIAGMKTLDIDADTRQAEAEIRKLRASIKALGDDASSRGGGGLADIGGSAKRGLEEAGEGLKNFKEESIQTARESAASFDGSAQSVADAFQEVSANAFAGFGAAGAGAGLAIAAGIGIGVQMLTQLADAANKVTDDAIAMNAAFSDAGDEAARVQVLQDRWTEFGNTINDVRSVWEVWQGRAVTNMEQFAKSARLAGLDVDALFSGFTDPDPERRLRELNKVLDQQTATLKELNRVGDSADPGKARAKQDERLAIEGTTKALREEITVSQAAIELDKSRADVAGMSVEAWQDQQAATEALTAAQDSYNQTLVDSADPVSVYADLLSEKTEQMKADAQAHADSTKEATGQAADSWEDYATDVTLSTQDLIDEWNRQAEATKEFETNLGIIAAAGGQALADELRAKGPEVAGAVASVIAKADPATQQAAIDAHANATGAAIAGGIAEGMSTPASQQKVNSAFTTLMAGIWGKEVPVYLKPVPGGPGSTAAPAAGGQSVAPSSMATPNLRVYIDGNALRATVRADVSASAARAALVGTTRSRP